jgi:hypothetical protein
MDNIKVIVLSAFVIVGTLVQIGCSGNDEATLTPDPMQKIPAFQNPQAVTVQGYSGDLMEPSISRDGQVLFFNNLNADKLSSGEINDTNIHYASRIDDLTFQYMGEINGADLDAKPDENELEGVPSMDKNNRFYLVNISYYFDNGSPNYLRSIFSGIYSNGILTGLQSLPNLRTDRGQGENPKLGELNFDLEIHYDGVDLYFVEGIFSGNSFPDEANIGIANKVNGVFTINAESKSTFLNINTEALEYAPSISTDNLELYFTRATGSLETGLDFGLYAATRNSISEPWQNVKRIDVIQGQLTEAPSISFDGKLLYYHDKIDGLYQIYVVERVE